MDENQPFISIIMPVYNAGKYLDKAIESVKSQTYKNWELIIIDDASTDNSGEIMDRWVEKDQRIRVKHLSQNVGAGQARNIGIDISVGTYITFMDGDDTINRELYKEVTSRLTPDTDMAVWGVTECYVDSNGRVTETNLLAMEEGSFDTATKVKRRVIALEDKTLFGYQWNHLYRSSIIKDNNIRFTEMILYEDYFFNLEIIEYVNSMVIVSHCGYNYYKRGEDSVTNRFVPEYYELSRNRVKSMYRAYRRWQMYTPQVKNSCGQRLMRYTLSALVRNNYPEADMTRKDKRSFVKAIYKDQLYQKLAKHCYIEQLPLRVLRGLINRRCTTLILFMGKLVYVIKEKKPAVYAKNKRIK